MPNAEELARFVASNSDSLTAEEKAKGRNYLVPPAPNPGEVIICQECGKPMLPEDFSKDPKIRRHEFKWHIHHACEQKIWDKVDRLTPGLLSERQNGIPTMRKAMRLGTPKKKNNTVD